jgi:hypothetical protein
MPAFAIVTMRDAEADYISVMLPEDWIFRRMVTQLKVRKRRVSSGEECPPLVKTSFSLLVQSALFTVSAPHQDMPIQILLPLRLPHVFHFTISAPQQQETGT